MSSTSEPTYTVNEPTVISETIDGETIIIHLKSGTYYCLKHSGAAIWAGLQRRASVASIASGVRASYAVEGQDVEGEISRLIARLIEEDLIRPAEAASPQPIAIAEQGHIRNPFLAPVLEKFTDMEVMILDPVHDVDDAGWPYLPKSDGRMDA